MGGFALVYVPSKDNTDNHVRQRTKSEGGEDIILGLVGLFQSRFSRASLGGRRVPSDFDRPNLKG